jgi:hypothetical protein
MSVQSEKKIAVTVAEMVKMLGLGRTRFYELMQAGIFPPPVYRISNRRPIYTDELQAVCLEVRRQNRGINGQPVVFNVRRHRPSGETTQGRKVKPKATERHAGLMDALRSLGLSARVEQVEAAISDLYPNGVENVDPTQLIKTVFLYIRRQDRGDSVGR